MNKLLGNKKLNGKVWVALFGIVMALVGAFAPELSGTVETLLVSIGSLLTVLGIVDTERKDEDTK
jgi:purine-cytosine permease-like protein